MADPVTLAVVGATAGAALNPDDPLKGAVIGGTLGYGGGALAGGAAAGTAAEVAAAETLAAANAGGAATAVPGSFTAELASQNIIPQMSNVGGSSLLAPPVPTTGAFDLYGIGAVENAYAPKTAFMSPSTPATATAAPTKEQMDIARRLMFQNKPQEQNAVSQGGRIRPGQAVNVVAPVASLLEPMRNRRPRPAFSLL
jgi:hypothetical protein